MYSGMTLGELPHDTAIHELKVRVPEDILMHDDKSANEGYLVHLNNDWFISPEPPSDKERPLYLLLMDMCNPLDDIVVV